MSMATLIYRWTLDHSILLIASITRRSSAWLNPYGQLHNYIYLGWQSCKKLAIWRQKNFVDASG